MNRGIMRNKRKYAKPWVYIPMVGFQDAYSNTGITADVASFLTTGLSREDASMVNVPRGARIRAVMVRVLIRSSAIGVGTDVYLQDFDFDARLGRGAGLTETSTGPAVYSGAVANHYHTGCVIVQTGGIDDLQFRCNVQWVAGTVTVILRCIGVFIEER